MCTYQEVAKECINGDVTPDSVAISIKKFPVHTLEIILFGAHEIASHQGTLEGMKQNIQEMVAKVALATDLAG